MPAANSTVKHLFPLFVAFLSACSGAPYVLEPVHEDRPVRSHPIYVVSHGWHTGLIVRGADLNRVVPALRIRFGQPTYYEIGWGDKGFYQAQEITTGLALQAMFWSRGAILHIVALYDAPQDYFKGEPIAATCLSESELRALESFLSASFHRDPSGQVIDLRQGIYGDSEFYDGEGRYYILNTCNKWTAKALRSAGLDMGHVLKLTAGSVMRSMTSHARACTALSGPNSEDF